MKKIDLLLNDYATYHQAPGNVVTHFFGIPIIIFGLIAMLQSVHIGSAYFTAAELLIILSSVYYLFLDIRLAGIMFMSAAALDLLARLSDNFWIGFILFVIGWIFQGVGHSFYEKKNPAFLKNLMHLFTGPLFLLNKIFHIRETSF